MTNRSLTTSSRCKEPLKRRQVSWCFLPPTLLLHFHFHTIHHISHFTMVDQLLAEYYQDDRLWIIDIPFNVGHNEALDHWHREAAKLVASLSRYRHVIVFVTMHSDPDTGNLWLRQDEHSDTCAAMVGNVSTHLFYLFILTFTLNPTVAWGYSRTLQGCTRRLYPIYVGLWCCGQQLQVPCWAETRLGQVSFVFQSSVLLSMFSISLGVGDALAFDVKYLSTVNTVDLLMKVTKSVVIYRFEFSQALEHSLKQCTTLGRHTYLHHPLCGSHHQVFLGPSELSTMEPNLATAVPTMWDTWSMGLGFCETDPWL